MKKKIVLLFLTDIYFILNEIYFITLRSAKSASHVLLITRVHLCHLREWLRFMVCIRYCCPEMRILLNTSFFFFFFWHYVSPLSELASKILLSKITPAHNGLTAVMVVLVTESTLGQVPQLARVICQHIIFCDLCLEHQIQADTKKTRNQQW